MLQTSVQSYQSNSSLSKNKHEKSIKKINVKLLSTQKYFYQQNHYNQTTYMHGNKPVTPNLCIRRGGPSSQIKKRNVKRIDFSGYAFDNLSTI